MKSGKGPTKAKPQIEENGPKDPSRKEENAEAQGAMEEKSKGMDGGRKLIDQKEDTGKQTTTKLHISSKTPPSS